MKMRGEAYSPILIFTDQDRWDYYGERSRTLRGTMQTPGQFALKYASKILYKEGGKNAEEI